MSNKEIEIKLRVENLEALLKFLDEKGKFVFEKNQKDEYFIPAHRNFIKESPIKEWLRLRDEEGKFSLNYKNWQYEAHGKAYHCDESEIVVDSYDKAKSILSSLNFEPIILVDKKRKVYNFEQYEIAIDDVADLGGFVEVEYKGEAGSKDAKEICGEMLAFVESTGCKVVGQDFAGYPFLLLEKKFGLKVNK